MASSVESTKQSIASVESKILGAESRLSQLIIAAKEELTALHNEKRILEEEVSQAQGEIAPIRRIPAEIMREVFLVIFEEDRKGQAGWLFASVCKRWRGLALETPRLWTRIRLVTSLDDENSANIVRLWIERAGPSMPLDIEIYLRVPPSRASIPADCAAPMLHSGPGAMAMARRARRRLDDLTGSVPVGNGSESWGHVVVFYLKQQIHRWKRFVFRYDRVFGSLSAFKSINGNAAPQLEDFEISSIETSLINFAEWPWFPNASNISLPALGGVSLTNTVVPISLTSSLLSSQPLHTIYISSPTTIQISQLMFTLAKHVSTLRRLSLNLTSLIPPVVPASSSTLPFTSTSPLCLPLLEELSLSGHSLLTQIAIAITTPGLEELNVDIDLGRGGVYHHNMNGANPFGGPQPLSYIEDIVIDLLNRGTPAPADKLKALSIAFGFGNGRRTTRERERERGFSDSYLQALKAASSCPCSGTTFLTPGHGHSPHLNTNAQSTPAPSVVHNSWAFLGSLPALESLKVGLGGHAGLVWGTNANANTNSAGANGANGYGTGLIPYNGSSANVADMIEGLLCALCVPDDDAFTGLASIGAAMPMGGGGLGNGGNGNVNGNVVTFTVGFPPPPPPPLTHPIIANNNPTVHTFNFPTLPNLGGPGPGQFPPTFAPPLPPMAMHPGIHMPPPIGLAAGAGPGAGGGGGGLNLGTYFPGWNGFAGAGAGAQGGLGINPNNAGAGNGNGWVLPSLTEIGIKVGSAAFLPSTNPGGPGSTTSFQQYLSYPNIYHGWSSSSSSLDDGPGTGSYYVRRLLEVVEGRNPKTGRGPSVNGVVPEKLERLEMALSVVGVPSRGAGHAGGAETPNKDKRGDGAGDKDKRKQSSGTLVVDGSVEAIVNAISASAAGTLNAKETRVSTDSTTRKPSTNAVTARTLVGPDSVAWAEERISQVEVRCECVLWEGNAGMARMW